MDDDEYPNFGNAWATNESATPSSATPPTLLQTSARVEIASRHTKKPSINSDADFFDRYPGPTPEKSRTAPLVEDVENDDGGVSPTSIRNQVMPTELELGVESEPASAVHPVQSLAMSAAERPTSHSALGTEAAHDTEGVVFQPGADLRVQERELEKTMPEVSVHDEPVESLEMKTTAWSETEHAEEEEEEEEEARHPESGYEHQGDLTEMEEAIEDAPSAPLMLDPEAPPTVEETLMVPAAGLQNKTDSSSNDNSHETEKILPHLDRSFTTNFTELSIQQAGADELETPIQTSSNDWPAVGDDRTFGELLEDEQLPPAASAPETASSTVPMQIDETWGSTGDDSDFDALLGNSNPTASTNNEDMTAMWQAALDDDDLLDDGNDLDPSKFFGDDDDGFLEDELPEATAATGAEAQRSTTSYIPTATPAQSRSQMLSYGHGRSAGTPQTGLHDVYGHAPQTRPSVATAQSFSDKAKGGYQSPYDLPLDVSKPRQRPRAAQQPSTQAVAPTPPPRTSSFSTTPAQPSARPPTAEGAVPPLTGTTPPIGTDAQSVKKVVKADDGFFADLPIASKPRIRPSGSYTPQSQSVPSTGSMSQQQPPRSAAPPVQPPQRAGPPPMPAQQTSLYGGLSHPETLPLLPDQPTAQAPNQTPPASGPPPSTRYSPSHAQAPAPAQSRFSPAPVSQSPAAASRYSPAPSQAAQPKRQPSIGTVPGIQQAYAFLPRTSSPLAFQNERQLGHGSTTAGPPASPPKTNGVYTPRTTSPDQASSPRFSPMDQEINGLPNMASVKSPPQRPKTQSPPTVMKASKYSAQSTARPSSALPLPTSSVLPRRQQPSSDLSFALPNDERAHDPLERWKGHPIFKWTSSGSIVTSFPTQTPFYAAGHGLPTVKCSPGSISLYEASSMIPMDDRNSKFPGPLHARSKGKKKDVVAWMSGKLEDLERSAEGARMDFQMNLDQKKRIEEKLILWKIVKIFAEHDGTLEGDEKMTSEVRSVLLPDLAQTRQAKDVHLPQSINATAAQSSSVDRSVILELRHALLEGQRERAVWLAEEKRLWGHAMLIASTMGQETWRQIIQSFVRSQVQSAGSDARSLAALYQVFAGNSEECVDELVPSSARAGFQMVSKVDGSVSGDPLQGLDQWRETLALVVGNRTPNDAQSLLALGKLLSSYGRAEAAHTCYLFARQIARYSGADDDEAHFVLLSANHRGHDQAMLGNDMDSIILSEIYEWALSLSAPASAVQYVPHLQSFKLIHAQSLAGHGLKTKAQAYCDHIGSAYKSTTRPSPYYHLTFTQGVDGLSALLSQSPQTGSQGYLTKTAMNKFSSGAASWITKSLLGDDEREANAAAGGDDASGPFGKVSGDSPGISRSVSSNELYNPMMGVSSSYGALGTTPPQGTNVAGRYAPVSRGDRYAPSSTSSAGLGADTYRPQAAARAYTAAAAIHSSPNIGSVSPDSRPSSSQDHAPHVSSGSYGYQPSLPEQSVAEEREAEDAFAQSTGLGLTGHQISSAAGAEGGIYETRDETSGGYEPPTAGYEPPSYQPYEPEPEQQDSNEDAALKPKKKSFMDDDDDDDLAARAAAMKKSQADREADEAFRKAAEADAQRDKAKSSDKRNSGWLSGWFKKDPDAQQQGPIRAKLGEENSFYYDENLKKWVNKKGGAETASAAAATPPPPRGPPAGPHSRIASAALNRPPTASSSGTPSVGPPSEPPSRTGTPGSGMNGSPMPPPAGVTALNGSGPPSRPATGMSGGSDLDDLLGGPPGPGRKSGGAGTKGKKKGRGYVDVMQK